MYKRKYRKGKPITSLTELYAQQFIFVFDKIIHRGWFGSWQIRFAQSYIERGRLYKAEKIESEEIHK